MTRKTLFLLLVSSLLLASISCRSIKKSQAQADSTITRSEQISQNWTKETVTEISMPASELLPFLEADSSMQLPTISPDLVPEKKDILARLGFKGKKAKESGKKPRTVSAPALISADTRVNIKKTERESGSLDLQKIEQKQTRTYEKDKSKESNPASWLIGISLAAITILICLIIIYKSKQRY